MTWRAHRISVPEDSKFPSLPAVGWFVAIPMLIIGVLLAFFLAIILAMAIVNMVRKDSFGKAFAIGEILSVIGRVSWGTYILWLIIMFVCMLIIGGIGSIPAIGWILSLIISPIFGVFVARSASLMYLEGISPEEPETVGAPKETAKEFCVYCGAEMTAEAIYCPKCGKKK